MPTIRRNKKVASLDKELGRTLRLLRKVRKITQMSMAAHLGISYQQIQKYETGRDRISCQRLVEMCKVLEVGFTVDSSGIHLRLF